MKDADPGRYNNFSTIIFDTGCITRYEEDFIDVRPRWSRKRIGLGWRMDNGNAALGGEQYGVIQNPLFHEDFHESRYSKLFVRFKGILHGVLVKRF